MKWESKVGYQMLSSLSLFKNLSSWMALLPLLLLGGGGLGFFSMLYTALLVALSTVLFAVSNHKAVPVEKSVQENDFTSVQEISDQKEDVAPNPLPKNQNARDSNSDQEEGVKDGAVSNTTRSLHLLPECEFQDQISTSEDSEVERWPFRGNMENQSPESESSDGSISDEESLIEIAIPSGHYVDPKKEEPRFINCGLQHQEFPSEDSFFTEKALIEFLAEFSDMAEEENLIEIDISMGSIKYSSRFEIEA